MLAQWLDEHEYKSIAQMTGSMSRNSASNPAAFERNNYMRVLEFLLTAKALLTVHGIRR
jgi:dihydroorotate dehydrogenase (fumarate)